MVSVRGATLLSHVAGIILFVVGSWIGAATAAVDYDRRAGSYGDARECHVFIISPIVAGVAAAVNATTGLWHAALCDVRSAAPVCVHQVMLLWLRA